MALIMSVVACPRVIRSTAPSLVRFKTVVAMSTQRGAPAAKHVAARQYASSVYHIEHRLTGLVMCAAIGTSLRQY